MEVFHCRDEGGGRTGGGVKISRGGDDVRADGDKWNAGTGVEGEDVGVEPDSSGGAASGEIGDKVIGDGEEEGDVGVGKGSQGSRSGVEEVDSLNMEAMEGGGHFFRRRDVGNWWVVGDAEGRGGAGGGAEDEGGVQNKGMHSVEVRWKRIGFKAGIWCIYK